MSYALQWQGRVGRMSPKHIPLILRDVKMARILRAPSFDCSLGSRIDEMSNLLV